MGGDLKRAFRPEGATASPEPLRLGNDTLQTIQERRLEGSRRKVMDYLRAVDPDTQELSDSELRRKVLSYERSGNALGLESERAHMKWAYVMSVTDGKAAQNDELREAFRRSPKHPDNAIDDLLDAMDEIWDRG